MNLLREYNFDGLIGPTHNYAGLSYGNVASASHRHQVAHPRAAALQGLAKMKALHQLGIGQAILPPLKRPHVPFLESLGFTGPPKKMLEQAFRADPVLLASCYSASNMWTANAATVSPANDTNDSRLHITVANLASTLHRSIEADATFGNLGEIFRSPELFRLNKHLTMGATSMADEGAANHTRLCPIGFDNGTSGLELFVYGVDTLNQTSDAPSKFPARQTRLASQSIARLHGLDHENCFFLQQNPKAIDAGVFHNDVISVGNQNVLLCHELAFVDQPAALQSIRRRFETLFGQTLFVLEFSNEEIPLADAVSSYLFNSQLVTRPDNQMTLVCPSECEANPAALRCTQRLLAEENPVDDVQFFDLRQSMNNGGGPACLRLRVPMTEAQREGIHPSVLFSDQRYDQLVDWVTRHYREQLAPDDLRDPNLVDEVEDAFAELRDILELNRLH
ncbi:MAG: N-succinylarginine dihydrolase [Planctomycetota bacterium]